ncbi:MAG: hypothetical protein WCC12_23680 [Anaerolineales bacterium]
MEHAFGTDIDYAMLAKVYGSSAEAAHLGSDKRYSPGDYVRSYKEVIRGKPTREDVSA